MHIVSKGNGAPQAGATIHAGNYDGVEIDDVVVLSA